MSVFTIFNHGTNANREKGEKKGELVHLLSKAHQGNEAKIQEGVLSDGDYMINEGPGSYSGNKNPGEANYITGKNKRINFKKFIQSEFENDFHGNTPTHIPKISGILSGAGWTDNTLRAVHIIGELLARGRAIDTVNLTGWSRGAVTCIRIANALHKIFPSIKCNIFAIDPVAGWNAGEDEINKNLPVSVKNFYAVLSAHERRGAFKPQDFSKLNYCGRATNVLFLPMPGTHDQQVIKKDGIEESFYLTATMAYTFLVWFGTNLDYFEGVIQDGQLICEKYSLLRFKMGRLPSKEGGAGLFEGAFKKKQSSFGKDFLMGGFHRRREFAKSKNMKSYVVGGKSGFWVNEHHREVFKTTYGDLYHKIFEMDGINSIKCETLQTPSLVNLLIAYGFCSFNRFDGMWVIPGCGKEYNKGKVRGSWNIPPRPSSRP